MKASLFTAAATLILGVSSVSALPHKNAAKRQCSGGGDGGSGSNPGNGTGSGGGDSGSSGAPHFVVYADNWLDTWPQPSDLGGWNVFNLAFLLTTGPADDVQAWVGLDDGTRQQIKSSYNAAGIKLMISAFGATEQPTTQGADPTQTANAIASFVQQYNLDGVDIDYEDLDAFDNNTGGEQWLITLTQQLRQQLPQGQYTITHAPLAPWFAPNVWGGGGYLAVDKAVGDLIDWYNVQFYNQGATEYTDCNGLFNQSSSAWPQTSVFEMAANGIPLDKIVVGKPGGSGDADNGYIDPGTLGGCVSAAASSGWNAGVMSWEWPDADANWIQAARGSL